MAQRLDANKGLGDFEDDLRVIVDYEVQILRHMLRDRLEWDLCSPLTPEGFARKLCDDLGLTGEAQALVANSVREQLINHKRAALELGLVGSGRVLKEKEREIEVAWAELHAEKMEKQRKKLERGESTAGGMGSETQSQVQSGEGRASLRYSLVPQQPKPARRRKTSSRASAQDTADDDTGALDTASTPAANAGEDVDEEDVETLHLTATATAAPTREGTSTPAIQPSSSSSLPSVVATRSSARLAESTDNPTSPATPSNAAPKLSASQRLHNATYTVREILSRGPRPLEGIWRDWHDSREFGPLLERLNDEDLEKLEEANVRASRRNRRDAARAFGGARRRR